MIVLDTNVIFELVGREPSPVVLRTLQRFPSAELYTTVISEAEIRFGLAILPAGRKRTALQAQVDLILTQDLLGRILPFDSDAARAYARIAAFRRSKGRPLSLPDAQIAAIVQAHEATLATRNARDFDGCGFKVIDPWRANG